jgi:hypothetical protein
VVFAEKPYNPSRKEENEKNPEGQNHGDDKTDGQASDVFRRMLCLDGLTKNVYRDEERETVK